MYAPAAWPLFCSCSGAPCIHPVLTVAVRARIALQAAHVQPPLLGALQDQFCIHCCTFRLLLAVPVHA